MKNGQFLQMIGITKTFHAVNALNNVDFDLRNGEVHAVIGENGAGKSTLMKIISGEYTANSGVIKLAGTVCSINSPAKAQKLGIAIVRQEKHLFPTLTVVENICIGNRSTYSPFGLVKMSKLVSETANVVNMFGVDIDLRKKVQDLSVGQQQIVEIVKALSMKAEILILDEPTSALSKTEADLLFGVIRRLRREGLGIIYISHRIEEIFLISDRITVLRDGQKVATLRTVDTKPQDVITLMVGRQLNDYYGQPSNRPGDVVLSVSNLSLPGKFDKVSFILRRGEIVGVSGLVGSGRTDIALSLFGYKPAMRGEILLEGARIWPMSPKQAMRLGIVYIPEDRRDLGLFMFMSLRYNISVVKLSQLAKAWIMDKRREYSLAIDMINKLRIRASSVEQTLVNLSGGNQQKVLLAKWLVSNPKILIVDEPTRGVDVGTKAEIYAILRSLAAQGTSVLMISSELPEILGISDRIVVIHDGQVAADLSTNDASEEIVMTYATGNARSGGVDKK